MMQRRNSSTAPHEQSGSFIYRYFEQLMTLTYENPVLMRDLMNVIGIGGLTLLSSPVLLPALGVDNQYVVAAATTLGAAGCLFSASNRFLQNRLFGFPHNNNRSFHQKRKFGYQTALAELIPDDHYMPLLRIKADNHYDAGYAEGYVLGEAMKEMFADTNFLHHLMDAALAYYRMTHAIGMTAKPANLHDFIAESLTHIPDDYKQEMRGKVDGYNSWLQENYPNAKPLSFDKYVLYQLMPDLHNYNPLPTKNNIIAPALDLSTQLGCTTIALRLGDYTFLMRVLDWPSHNVAGKHMLQVERNIADEKRTIDIGIPVLSGALTVVNNDGMLVEINISHGDRVGAPRGMPAVFYNRYVAEHADRVKAIDAIVEKLQPVGPYHMTASDGVDTHSYHFFQDDVNKGEHVIDALANDKKQPQILVVTNKGMNYTADGPKVSNHRDSDKRTENIMHLFNQPEMQEALAGLIEKQASGEPLTEEDLLQLKEIGLQFVRLPIVNNCQSVLCGFYVYHGNDLVDVSAALDNLYAQNKELQEFQRLRV